jgi:hypothetical protein
MFHSRPGLLYKSSCLAPALGATKFIAISLVATFVRHKSDLDVQQTHLRILDIRGRFVERGSCLAQTLGMTKFINVRYMISVALSCAT